MVQYILECISFQLVFLVIYDFLLKKETFFQWNRMYLLGTHLLSYMLPWIKIEALKTAVPEAYYVYPEFLWDMEFTAVELGPATTPAISLSWQEGVFLMGMLVATLLFGYKMRQLYLLRNKGKLRRFKNFTQIIVHNSNLAFSFFRSIYMGDQILPKEHGNIIQHELVHIRQGHSLDLLLFEVLRIVMWFNPLVYVYQSRIAELHEFIADVHVAKKDKKEHYQILLSQVFQTQHISFVNQFFKTSLIKKRIVMLQRSRSKKIWQLKYLLLIPMILGMLIYTSVAQENAQVQPTTQDSTDDTELIRKTMMDIENDIAIYGDVGKVMYVFNAQHAFASPDMIYSKEEFFKQRILTKMNFIHMWEEIAARGGALAENSKERLSFINNFPAPSTAMYNSYVDRKKAFQIIDDNLGLSIDAYKQEVVFIEPNAINTADSYVHRVADITDLTGIELREFNTRSAEIFEQEGSEFNSLVIRDDNHAFKVFKKPNPIIDVRNETIEYNTTTASSNTKEKSLQDKDIVPFNIVDKVPVFPGCEGDDDKRGCFHEYIRRHIRKNFNYPEEAQQREIEGIVTVMFMIDKEGAITHIRANGKEQLLTDESKRIISLLPAMKPGVHQGKKVKVPFSIPITFKITADTNSQKHELVNASDDIAVPFAVVEEVPVFPGCENETDPRACFQAKMQKHIAKNFRYPEEAQKLGIQGRVNLMFMIDPQGDITGLRMRGPHKLLEEEAARIISLLPKMKPGKHRGKAVRVPFSMPITFKLEGVKGNRGYYLLPNNLEGMSPDQKVLIAQYNHLAIEYYRIVTKKETKDPEVVQIRQQLDAIVKEIDASGYVEPKPNTGVVEVADQKQREMISDDMVPFAVADEAPIFPGCENETDPRACFQAKMQKHISKNFRYPAEAQQQGIQGRVNIMFTIDKKGDIGSVRLRGPHKLLEEEAVRIISLLPKMQAGKHQGKTVRIPFSIPITFKLHSDVKKTVESNESISDILQGLKKREYPLFFIDGKQANHSEVSKLENNKGIQSIRIIKDKYVLGKYGKEAKNGVIEITTKQ